MVRRTPRSTLTDTLFPYTTLFRSRSRTEFAYLLNGPKRYLVHPAPPLQHDGWPFSGLQAEAVPVANPRRLVASAHMEFQLGHPRAVIDLTVCRFTGHPPMRSWA